MERSYQKEYQEKLCTAAEAVKLVRSGDRVFIGFASSIAYKLTDALWERKNELENVEIQSDNSLKPTPMYMSRERSPFRVSSSFLGPGERAAAKNGRPLLYTSFHLSQVDLWCREVARPTVCFFEVSEPDDEGYMSYGPSGGSVNEFAKGQADRIILQVNRNVPYVTGQHCLIHVSEATAIVEADDELAELPEDEGDDITRQISAYILEQIPDGATIQLGLGKLSTVIGYGLRERNDLGLHTELFSEPMMHLIKNGNVTNMKKGFMDGKSVFSFALGSRAMYDFMDHNLDLYCGTFPYVNDSRTIARNRNMVSINTAMAIDLYGQAAADAMGWKQQSAVGGQIDFVKGAQWSVGGKSILATASTFVKNGVRQSKIVLNFPEGTAVTTPRSEVQYVATEYGCVNLKVLTMQDRVRAMIGLAHPDFRDQLMDEAKKHAII